MGGGLKTGFRLEQYIDMKNVETVFPEPKTAYARAAHLWLEGGFGQFKMGRAETPSHNAILTWSAVGNANDSPVTNRHASVGYPARASSQFSYKTPVPGGFGAEVAFIARGDNNDKAKYDLNLIYDNGPLSAGIACNKVRKGKANYAPGGK